MSGKISVVINTRNEEQNIERAIKSVKWADEIVVCDMHSEDQTVELAKKLGAKVVFHEPTGFVEPARNFAINSTSGDWILILDADEEIPPTLGERLKRIVKEDDTVVTHIEIPRKNIMFDKWVEASNWWPDYNIRYFKKGAVVWSNKIHSKPEVSGQGLTLPAEESMAINHYHYTSISQYLERLNRYTSVQAKELTESGYKFKWVDLIRQPLGEFLSRFFAGRGYEDGLHGLVLSMLQAFSFVVVYAKVWEMEGFKEQDIKLSELNLTVKKGGKELNYWFRYSTLSKNPLTRLLQKAKNRVV